MVIPIWGWELGGQPWADPGSLGQESRKRIQHCTPPFLLRLQGLLTLFAEFFASFDHSTSALSVPGLYASLRWIHIALQTAVPSHSTRGCGQPHPGGSQCTGLPYGTVSLFCGSIPGLFLALGTPGRSQPLHSPQGLLDSNESRSRERVITLSRVRSPNFRKSRGSCSFIRHYCSNRCCLLFLH